MRALLAGLVALAATLAITAAPALAAPILSVESPTSGTVTNQTRPVVSGVTSDTEDPVAVTISSEGSFVESANAIPNESSEWSVRVAELQDGSYTATAEQTESLSGETTTSSVDFTIDTQPPEVTLNPVSSPANDTTPSFSGTASDTTEVSVYIFEGTSAGGTVVSEAHANPSGGKWFSGTAETALEEGTYTAIAEQKSSIGNPEGFSKPRTFTVHTAKPSVSMNSVSSPPSDSTPSFSGTASEKSQVTVDVYAAGDVGGTVLAVAHATPSGGKWSTGGASPPLADGTYTAVAEQESEFGEGPGSSQERTFTVHTAKPSVTLSAVESPTADSTPSFSGTASEETTVRVKIYKGTSATGTPVTSVTAAGTGGSWSSGSSSTLTDGTYTARAEQESEFGDGPGFSEPQTFTVDTQPPKVTLNAIETPSGNQTPSFTGTAGDTSTVTVSISKGGSEVESVNATGTGGAWSSEAAGQLGEGTYTAVATQTSSHGTGTGKSAPIEFKVIASPPKVILNAIASLSNDTTPSFTGTASDPENPVTITIYSNGTKVSTASATGTGGAWSSGDATPALASGHYTAKAEQESSFGKGPGKSNEIGFTVDTSSPTVTLESIPTPSKNSTPTFSGTASDTTSVVVHVFDGSDHEVAKAEGSPSGGKWKSGGLSKALATGSYTAVAVQSSSLGNPPGQSENIGFTVNTEAPHVTLNEPPGRSRDTTPSFTGTATDTTTVTVNVYKGTTASGSPFATATAAGTGGSWSAGAVSKELETGTYTARAVQKSSLGNPEGFSESHTFEVNTNAPEVTLNAPPARSNDTTPSFSGTASEHTAVTVEIFKGTSVSGSPVSIASATGTGGTWTSGASSPGVAPGTYTAIARQKSELSNPDGLSEPRTFVIDTSPPTVKLDEPVAALSKNRTPTFTGTATDTTAVTVHVFNAAQQEIGSASATPEAGKWTSGAVSPTLEEGAHEYTAVAEQKSSIGNAPGLSNKISFAVNTSPPTVKLEALAARINSVGPTFTGTVVDDELKDEPVTVHIREAGGSSDVATATATVASGKWTSGALSTPLAKGRTSYEAFATQPSSLGNEEGKSNVISFVVDTEPPTVTLNEIPKASNERTPKFSGTASDTRPVKVEIEGGGKKFTEEGTLTGDEWSASSLTLPETKVAVAYVATASQESSIGNPTGKSKPVKFVVDPNAPSILMAPVRPQINTPTPTFTGTASDTTPVTVSICKVTTPCAAEEGEWSAKSAGGGAWSASVPTTTPLPDGTYQAIASERGASLGETERQMFVIDTVAPTVGVSSPAQGQTLLGSSVTVKGSAGLAANDEPSVTVQLFAGPAPTSSPIGPPPTVIVSHGEWAAAFSGLSPGEYTVRAIQSDKAGNAGTAVRTFTMALPAAPATGPSASFNWFPTHPHVGEKVTLVSTSTDSASPITGYAWDLLGSAFASGSLRQTASFSTPGNHPVGLRVTDAGGLSRTSTEQIPVSYPLMRPFPVVRIVTTRAHGRLRLKALTVEGPAGATITVTCTGKGCPLRSQSRVVPRLKGKSGAVQSISFPRFESGLPAGVALEIRVSGAGQVGKFTRLTVRKGKLPLRADACVNAKEPRPVPCSS
ncbi:MAG TPA: Ig-like domain-containing protein [Solirubrobacteraceae bacterium]|nr:Ig-like domain-containing protein [Solirubrobacteraceae bacterium]